MRKKIFSLLLILVLLLPFSVLALTEDYQNKMASITNTEIEDGKVNFYLFKGEGCPHCADEEKWLQDIKKEYKDYVNFYEFEVWYDENNSKMMEKAKEIFDFSGPGVPFTVIGDKYYSGFSDSIGTMMENTINDYLNTEINDDFNKKIDIPILGKVNMKNSSLGIIAIVLGFVDGFNPCAMWILLFLINMFLGTKDKKKSWILGFTFVVISAFIYFLSMLGINVIIGVATVGYLKIAIAIFILIMGIFSLRKYLKIRKEEAGCSIVDNRKRKKLVTKVKKIISSKNFILSIVGISTLAISVNLIELACSLGFPMIFTEMLTINNITGISRILYLLLYIFFYMIDDMVVFTISMITLQATGITNKYNKLCALVSSIIMIIMGLLLIFKPEWLMLNF